MAKENKTKQTGEVTANKGKKFSIVAIILAIAILLAVVPLNMLASSVNVEWDMSSNNMYSLSDTSKKVLDTLDFDVTIYLLSDRDRLLNYYKPSDGTKYVITKTLAKIADDYDSYDKITVKYVDPTTEPQVVNDLNPDGSLQLDDDDIIVQGNGKTKKVDSTNLVYSNADDGKYYFTGENYITSAIQYLISGVEPTVYFLTGHGEKTLADDYSLLNQNMESSNYVAKELNLTTADAVPADAEIIIIPAPKNDITDAEKDKLNDYLDKGGNISFLMSPNGDKVRYKNIEAILDKYAICMDYDKVYETDNSKHVSGDPYTIIAELVEGDDLTTPLIEIQDNFMVYMTPSRSFYAKSFENEQLTVSPLMMSSATAVGEAFGGTAVNPSDIKGSALYLAMYGEDKSRNDSKVVVMGNAEFIDDENASKGYTIIPMYLFLSTLTWMYDSSVDMMIASKTQSMDSINIPSEADGNKLLAVIICIPVVIAGAGLAVWLRRRHC